MKILVTGASGFIGKHLTERIMTQGMSVVSFEVTDAPNTFDELVGDVDAIIHLAGVNRPVDTDEFTTGNVGLTSLLCEAIAKRKVHPLVLFSSSTQAILANPYGRSKREAEEALEQLAQEGTNVIIYRLPNVFGPGARPNYNSVVATFAYNATHDVPLSVHDAKHNLTLAYVDDVVSSFLAALASPPPPVGHAVYCSVEPTYQISVGELSTIFLAYRESRATAFIPAVQNELERKLYATYLSYLKPDDFAYSLMLHTDHRGGLAELLKSTRDGQIFVSRTAPGVTRGNHFHHVKTEKFIVVEGEAIIRFRRIDTDAVIAYPVNGRDFKVVDIPPYYTHSIENIGTSELIVLFWASEIFDPYRPDTYPSDVL